MVKMKYNSCNGCILLTNLGTKFKCLAAKFIVFSTSENKISNPKPREKCLKGKDYIQPFLGSNKKK